MKTMQLLQGVKFGTQEPHAEPLYVDKDGRALLFALKPGQTIKEHNAPNSPFYVVVLQGRGMFAGGDGTEQVLGPSTLLVFDPQENHTIRALDEDLIFVGFLRGAPGNVSERLGGLLGRQAG
jgi:quercetin dioxygenase-like cupin family protein